MHNLRLIRKSLPQPHQVSQKRRRCQCGSQTGRQMPKLRRKHCASSLQVVRSQLLLLMLLLLPMVVVVAMMQGRRYTSFITTSRRRSLKEHRSCTTSRSFTCCGGKATSNARSSCTDPSSQRVPHRRASRVLSVLVGVLVDVKSRFPRLSQVSRRS